MMKIGFIGTGNMGGALASAAARSGEVEVLLANRTKAKAETLAERIGAVVSSNEIIAREADHIFLGVKPQMIVDVLKGIAPALKERKSAPVLISMVTGLDIARIQELAGGDYPVIRIMPNMPAAVGEGVIFYACSGNCGKAQQEAFLRYMAPAGKLFPLAEELHAAGSAVAGCGPAFAAIFLESMADGGVACGVGDPVCRADDARHGQDGARDEPAPRRAQGQRLLARGLDDPGRAHARRARHARGGVRRRDRGLREKRRAQKGERLRLRRKGIFPARQA